MKISVFDISSMTIERYIICGSRRYDWSTPSPLTLSQRERGFTPFSLWEKGGDEGKTFRMLRAEN